MNSYPSETKGYDCKYYLYTPAQRFTDLGLKHQWHPELHSLVKTVTGSSSLWNSQVNLYFPEFEIITFTEGELYLLEGCH